MWVRSRTTSKMPSPSPRFGASCPNRSASLTRSPQESSAASLAVAHDRRRTSDLSFDGKPQERSDPAKGLQLLARFVVSAHQDDGPSSGLRGPHEVLDSGIPHDRIAHQESLDRAGINRLGNFRGSVRARLVRRNRLKQLLDEPRLVTDPTVSEDLCAHAGFERLLNPLHPRSEEHTSELQSQFHLVCRLLLEKKKNHDD